MLADQARASGVDVALGTGLGDARLEHDRWRCDDGTLARFLVGADGPSSRVARIRLGQNRQFLFGIEVEIADATLADAARLHCFVDRRLARGYIGWAFQGVGIVQAGLAIRRKGERAPVPTSMPSSPASRRCSSTPAASRRAAQASSRWAAP